MGLAVIAVIEKEVRWMTLSIRVECLVQVKERSMAQILNYIHPSTLAVKNSDLLCNI